MVDTNRGLVNSEGLRGAENHDLQPIGLATSAAGAWLPSLLPTASRPQQRYSTKRVVSWQPFLASSNLKEERFKVECEVSLSVGRESLNPLPILFPETAFRICGGGTCVPLMDTCMPELAKSAKSVSGGSGGQLQHHGADQQTNRPSPQNV